MYQAEELAVYPFFRKTLSETPLSSVLDSLTGVVSRNYMISFLHELVDSKTVFTLGIIDLDNFKSFNDNYGHKVGDKVLAHVAETLRKHVGSRGIVGRFGGDEFLVVSFIGNDYDVIHDYYASFYTDSVFRRVIAVDDLKLYITATIGSASFPKDAQDYDTLFSLIDKALYRGKFKGRNCYIIYLAEKHAGLTIPKLAQHSLYDAFVEVSNAFDENADLISQLKGAFTPLNRNLHFHFLFLVDRDLRVTDVVKGVILGESEDLAPLISDGYFACSQRRELDAYPLFCRNLEQYLIHSLLILPIGRPEDRRGFLVFCPEPRTHHIWQDQELAAGFYLARLTRDHILPGK